MLKKSFITLVLVSIFSTGLFAGNTALYNAIDYSRLDEVKQLVEAGADIENISEPDNAKSPSHSALAYSVAHQSWYVTDYLMTKNPNVNGKFYDPVIFWLIHKYSEDSIVSYINKMLPMGLNVNIIFQYDKNTPLHKAAGAGYKKVVNLLIANGANKYAKKSDGKTPADVARDSGHIELANDLDGKSNDEYRKTLMYAIKSTNMSRVKEILRNAGSSEKRTLLNKTDLKKNTPLHLACKIGSLEIVKVLVDNGANIQLHAIADFTPLHYAAVYGHADVADYLIKKGAKINVVQSAGCATGFTSVNWAIQNSMFSTLRLMKQHGGDFSASDRILYGARSVKLLKLLIEEFKVKINFTFVDEMKASVAKLNREKSYYYESYKTMLDYILTQYSDAPPMPNANNIRARRLRRKSKPKIADDKDKLNIEPYNATIRVK